MADYLTIFGTREDPAAALQAVRALDRSPAVDPPNASPTHWRSLRINRGTGSLTLNWCDARTDPAKLDRLRQGMRGHFESAQSAPPDIRARAIDFVDSFVVAVGVVAEPRFAEDESDFDVVWAVNEVLNGLVWNGNGLVLPDGRLLLNGDGVSDLA